MVNKKIYTFYTQRIKHIFPFLYLGLVFGDKLYCPIHGCAYCIKTGRAEYAPAIDSLPRFHIEEVNKQILCNYKYLLFYNFQKEGKVTVFAPKIAPIRVIAPSGFRDYNDLRKIIVIGGTEEKAI